MKILSQLLLTLGLAIAASVGTYFVMDPKGPLEAEAAPGPGRELAPAHSNELMSRLASMEARIEELSMRPASVSERSSAVDLEAAIARALDARGLLAGAPQVASSPDATQGLAQGDLKDILSALFDQDLSQAEKEALWAALRDAGRLEEVVAAFEERVAEDPNNPDKQVELGQAYLQLTMAAGAGPEAGKWAGKADKVFDLALELNPDHWDARFHKAISLSFWPPIFGKQPQAVEQFEILLETQKTLPTDQGHAETYLYLGNLYAQMGDLEKAQSTWAQGFALFPNHEGLQGKLGG